MDWYSTLFIIRLNLFFTMHHISSRIRGDHSISFSMYVWQSLCILFTPLHLSWSEFCFYLVIIYLYSLKHVIKGMCAPLYPFCVVGFQCTCSETRANCRVSTLWVQQIQTGLFLDSGISQIELLIMIPFLLGLAALCWHGPNQTKEDVAALK